MPGRTISCTLTKLQPGLRQPSRFSKLCLALNSTLKAGEQRLAHGAQCCPCSWQTPVPTSHMLRLYPSCLHWACSPARHEHPSVKDMCRLLLQWKWHREARSCLHHAMSSSGARSVELITRCSYCFEIFLSNSTSGSGFLGDKII